MQSIELQTAEVRSAAEQAAAEAGRRRESSMSARVETEMSIPTMDEDEHPRIEELELSSATYTKMLARICGG